jgi:hypothetical protein
VCVQEPCVYLLSAASVVIRNTILELLSKSTFIILETSQCIPWSTIWSTKNDNSAFRCKYVWSRSLFHINPTIIRRDSLSSVCTSFLHDKIIWSGAFLNKMARLKYQPFRYKNGISKSYIVNFILLYPLIIRRAVLSSGSTYILI